MQEMLAHTKKSYEANPDLSTSASVPSHGWIERERRERESRKGNGQHAAVEDQGDRLDNEKISRIIAQVQEAQPSIKLEAQNDNRSITVRNSSKTPPLSTDISSRRNSSLIR